MIKKVFLPLMLLALVLQTGREALLFAWYHYNLSGFEQRFCENIDAPQLECHAKCQLEKMVEAQPLQPNPQNNNLLQWLQLLQLYSASLMTEPRSIDNPAFKETMDGLFDYAFLYSHSFHQQLLKPPQ
jgi:hypothetical protein